MTGQGSIPNFAFSFNEVANYTVSAGSPFLIQVNSVPEPSSLALCGIATLIGLGFAKSRRKAAT